MQPLHPANICTALVKVGSVPLKDFGALKVALRQYVVARKGLFGGAKQALGPAASSTQIADYVIGKWEFLPDEIRYAAAEALKKTEGLDITRQLRRWLLEFAGNNPSLFIGLYSAAGVGMVCLALAILYREYMRAKKEDCMFYLEKVTTITEGKTIFHVGMEQIEKVICRYSDDLVRTCMNGDVQRNARLVQLPIDQNGKLVNPPFPAPDALSTSDDRNFVHARFQSLRDEGNAMIGDYVVQQNAPQNGLNPCGRAREFSEGVVQKWNTANQELLVKRYQYYALLLGDSALRRPQDDLGVNFCEAPPQPPAPPPAGKGRGRGGNGNRGGGGGRARDRGRARGAAAENDGAAVDNGAGVGDLGLGPLGPQAAATLVVDQVLAQLRLRP